MGSSFHIRRWNDGAKLALIGLLSAMAALLAITALALGLSSLNDHQALEHANQALKQSVSTKQLVRVINNERADYIRQSCSDQNTRHDNTISALTGLYQRKLAPVKLPGVSAALIHALSELRVVQTQASRAPTLLIINALVPHQDCNQLVKTATTPSNR